MYTHHVVTVWLMLNSYTANQMRGGTIVLAIHDLSDVPADIVKMAHALGLGKPFLSLHCKQFLSLILMQLLHH
jgi:hypothetical protein